MINIDTYAYSNTLKTVHPAEKFLFAMITLVVCLTSPTVEPTAWLDPRHAREFMELLEKLSQEGKTIVISTHDVDLAYSWSDRVAIMQSGEIIAHGEPGEVFRQPEIIKRADLVLPWMLEMHSVLVQKGWLSPVISLPKTRGELFGSIAAKSERKLSVL